MPFGIRRSPSCSRKKRMRSRFWSGRKFTRPLRRPLTAARMWPISSRASFWRTRKFMHHELVMIVLIVVAALFFDFLNGFHDAANSIATVVSTRVLTPGQAVLWAAFFNFVAAFTVGTYVAKTVGKGMVDPSGITAYVILAAL